MQMKSLPDCHTHLDFFTNDLAAVIAEAQAAEVSPLIAAGMDLESSRACISLALQNDSILAAIGLHPWRIAQGYRDSNDLEGFRELAKSAAVSAISEVGLDVMKPD